ncbi:MAG TPA: type I restriction enzyme HsdR N-terminal domain-containing protein [Saprospiraceae bacterium]|nr:type I restriction enzyme HsdR N-terminal domain-containing protein [Saprospiraceae bacterium]
MLLRLDLLPLQNRLRLRRAEGVQWVYDPIRRKHVVLTPEELLRQLVLLHLLEVKRYPANRIRVEIGIEWNGLKKRCDVVVFDAELKPWLLVECKSPKVALTQSAFEQAARYNLQLQAPHLAITNGLATFCCRLDLAAKHFTYLPDFPDWPLSPPPCPGE